MCVCVCVCVCVRACVRACACVRARESSALHLLRANRHLGHMTTGRIGSHDKALCASPQTAPSPTGWGRAKNWQSPSIDAAFGAAASMVGFGVSTPDSSGFHEFQDEDGSGHEREEEQDGAEFASGTQRLQPAAGDPDSDGEGIADEGTEVDPADNIPPSEAASGSFEGNRDADDTVAWHLDKDDTSVVACHGWEDEEEEEAAAEESCRRQLLRRSKEDAAQDLGTLDTEDHSYITPDTLVGFSTSTLTGIEGAAQPANAAPASSRPFACDRSSDGPSPSGVE